MIAAAGPSALWYLTRGTGLVTLLLLTASVVLGILQVLRWSPTGSPRFVVVSLHRAISLLVVALLAVHVLTAVLDGFAPIRLVDAVLPFAGSYRPVWLGLGALALDLIVALALTSLLRRRLGLRAWRVVHWLAYVCWPVALVHGWGTGTDTRTPWMLAVTLGCAAAVLGSIFWRLGAGRSRGARAYGLGLVAVVAVSLAMGAWLAAGPLADGWARRSGTPATLLATAPRSAAEQFGHSFAGRLQGTVTQGTTAAGMRVVDVRMRLSGGASGVLRVRVAGDPLPGGGVSMRRSTVTLGPRSSPRELHGRITDLHGSSLDALVRSSGGDAVRLRLDLTLSDDAATGTVSGDPVSETVG